MPNKIVFTEAQIEELKQLIARGVKQTDIAKHFKVTDDTIRRICKENSIEIRMPYKCVCVICGDIFYSNIKGARTCKKEHHRICKVCGKDFIVDKADIRDTCKGECSNIAKYGVSDPRSLDQTKEHRKQTLIAKHGVINASQIKGSREKAKATSLERYGVENYRQATECNEKIKATNLRCHGYEWSFGDPKRRTEIDEIIREKYGTKWAPQSDQIKAKTKQTNISKYGFANVMQCPEIVDRLRKNNNAKFGCWASQSDEVKQKLSQTCLERYGVEWACMRPEARNYKCRSKVNLAFEELLKKNDIEYVPEFALQNYSYDFKCSNTFVEINPTPTHNTYLSIFKDSEPIKWDYHLNKTETAVDNGFRCINVFDWDNWDIIMSLIKPKKKVFARKCVVKQISKEEAERFTESNHLQGSCRGQELNYGLFFEDELIQVMTFGKPRYSKKYDLELLRLCSKSDITVVGGASKLFTHFLQENPTKTIISYCDASKFSGSVYLEIGMKLAYRSSPAKVWSKGTKYVTDNLLRQRGYDQLFGTNYGKGTSNEELMIQNGWLPVYDCGQLVFEYVP